MFFKKKGTNNSTNNKRNTSSYLLVLTIAAALSAGFLGMKIIEKYTNTLPVVVARTEIPAYTPITEERLPELLTVEYLPKASINKKTMFDNPQAVLVKSPELLYLEVIR
ncbi:hypothetical protein N752_01130 [Desulforamulus aquiferis]|nr:SAF domain-containing protein [Desulforamulus aquiferis]RYD07218.1 hypothetical protein N752_01130 [Desulforamulus aquiferis]